MQRDASIDRVRRRYPLALPLPMLLCCLLVSHSCWADDVPDRDIHSFLRRHCADCHSTDSAEGYLRLDNLSADWSDEGQVATWIKVHDRIAAGEMPPSAEPRPDLKWRDQVLETIAENIAHENLQRQLARGRTRLRRLSRSEYEHTLRDLLHLPHLEVKNILPADGEAHGFDRVGEALNVSSVQMARYLEAADTALRQAMQLGPRPATIQRRITALQNGRFASVAKKEREAIRIGDAVGLLRQPNTAQAPWFWGKSDPGVSGMYRIRMKVWGMVWDRGKVLPPDRSHAVTLLARLGQTRRPLGTFDVPDSRDAGQPIELTAWIQRGDQTEISFPTMDDRHKPAQVPMDGYSAPGVAVEWLEIEGPLLQQWPPNSYRQLFDQLPTEFWSESSGVNPPPMPIRISGSGKRAKLAPDRKSPRYVVVSDQPHADAKRLLHRFAGLAFRRPVTAQEIEPYVNLVTSKLKERYCFQEAMRVGYQAILCAPEFLFFDETPGLLDDTALANRLSYFLWNSLPDERLRSLASQERLRDPAVLRAEAERMLDDPRCFRFVQNFASQWLDLRHINETQPDQQLYPEFDPLLLESMVKETEQTLQRMIQQNSSATEVIDADWACVNERLAQLYGIAGVRGVSLRTIDLPNDSPRGGLLTQASVLKVTANGTTTSPVTRGAWVQQRLLGRPVPPPPPSVPAIEPDLRGTTTIRQQLSKHRDDESCAICHRTIDPLGFALESYDVIGGWRDHYRILESEPAGEGATGSGKKVKYRQGPAVDSSGVTAGGHAFDDIHQLKSHLLADSRQIARNLAEQLLVYSTGAGIEFADRKAIDQILSASEPTHYGVRTLIHEVIQSEVFHRK